MGETFFLWYQTQVATAEPKPATFRYSSAAKHPGSAVPPAAPLPPGVLPAAASPKDAGGGRCSERRDLGAVPAFNSSCPLGGGEGGRLPAEPIPRPWVAGHAWAGRGRPCRWPRCWPLAAVLTAGGEGPAARQIRVKTRRGVRATPPASARAGSSGWAGITGFLLASRLALKRLAALWSFCL